MLNHGHFYHATIRNSIICFGKLFNQLYIKREGSTGTTEQFIKVPITYGPKEKWLVRSETDPDLNRPIEIILPRMTFEINDFQFDTQRKLNSLTELVVQSPQDSSKQRKQFAPVPYNLGITLYIISKTQEDALQIVEQILPFFSPAYNLTVNLNPDMGYSFDVPTILNSVSLNDDYDGQFEIKRTVLYTLQFTMKTQMFGPVKESSVIRNVQATIQEPFENPLTGQTESKKIETYTAAIAQSTPITTNPIPLVTDEWDFDFDDA
jgi:hypothetical protein